MIHRFKVSDFRCIETADLHLSPAFNLICGANASGKTSFLEALAYLGRGKSFRGASTVNLIRHGEAEFVLFGETDHSGRAQKIGVRNSREGLEVRVDGSSEGGAAALAEALPLQVIDPEVHNLVAGGPELRRRFLDWVAFHVEHDHLEAWRRFRRALKQRNAALKAKSPPAAIRSWNAEFVELASLLDESRRRVLDITLDALVEYGVALLGTELGFEYAQGWNKEKTLEQATPYSTRAPSVTSRTRRRDSSNRPANSTNSAFQLRIAAGAAFALSAALRCFSARRNRRQA